MLFAFGFCLSVDIFAEDEPQQGSSGRTEERDFRYGSSERFERSERSRRPGFRREGGMSRPMRPMGVFSDPNAPATDPNAPAADPNQPVEMLEAINLNNTEMSRIVQKIADWTQKPVIPTSDEVMKTRISIYSPKKVPRDEALSLIITALHAKGVVVEELEDMVFLRPLASVRLGSVPTVGVDESLARIQEKTTIVEKWFQLKSYSPTRLIQIINPLIAEYGYTVADEGTMRVAVIDTVENLMRIERLIQQVDIPESDQEIEQVFELKNGDPLEIVQVLQIILGQQNNSRSRSGSSSGSRGSSGGSGGQQNIKNAVSVTIGTDTTPIRLIPMTQQRWILARASREDMMRIEKWIKKLDIADSAELHQVVIQVHYADVQEVARMVQNTIQKMPGTDVKTNIVVEALPKSSQIVVYGNEPNRKMVEKLIAEIDLPQEDTFIENTVVLKHADPDEIKKKIDELYGENVPRYDSYTYYRYGAGSKRKAEDTVRVIAYPLLKQVTVIASEGNMGKITAQIKEWDKPLDIELDQYRILSLKNSDPVQLSELLQRLFSEDSGGSQDLFRMFFRGDTSDSQKKIVGSLYGMLTFEPVPDTKKLIVISKIPEAYEVIERLVEKLDSQEVAEVPKVITLNYADAEDLCDQLNAILNEAGTPATLRRQVEGLSDYDPESSTSAGTNTDNNAGTITPWWTRQRRDDSEMPSSNLIGQVRFVPVHRSKAILVLSPPEYIDDITMMIKELDRPGMQVMIKVVIVDINLSDATSLGVQYASDPSAFGTLGVNAMTALNELTYADTFGSFTFSSGTDISVLVDLLVKKANGRILNQPTLWTKDNEEAIFVKGQKIGFIENVQSDNSNPNSFNRSFTYEDVGVTLRIRPNITPERAVDMTINLNISNVEDELINTQIVRGNLDTTTHLIVNDGQSVMLGGILERNDGIVVQKVPLLGSLPILGALFRHEKTVLTNSELLIFMTPYVIDDVTLEDIPLDEMSTEEFLQYSRMKMEDIVDRLSDSVMQLPEDPNDLY
jgi:general secretion pathway protein D